MSNAVIVLEKHLHSGHLADILKIENQLLFIDGVKSNFQQLESIARFPLLECLWTQQTFIAHADPQIPACLTAEPPGCFRTETFHQAEVNRGSQLLRITY